MSRSRAAAALGKDGTREDFGRGWAGRRSLGVAVAARAERSPLVERHKGALERDKLADLGKHLRPRQRQLSPGRSRTASAGDARRHGERAAALSPGASAAWRRSRAGER